jgi:hypothetical protein
MERDENVA